MKRALCAALFALAVTAEATEPDIYAGAVFLVPNAELAMPAYRGTVVIAAPTPGGGHVGVILNRPTKRSLASVYPEHEPSRAVRDNVHFGGTRDTDQLFAVVRSDSAPSALSLELTPGVWLVFDAPAIDKIIETRPNAARYYAGIVLWMPGQLHHEIELRVHTVLPADASKLFLPDTSKLREELAPADEGGKISVPREPQPPLLRI